MQVQFQNNSLNVSHHDKIFQLHPVWLRERLPGEDYFDIDTHQRLYEPSSIDLELQITNAELIDSQLKIEFNDGVKGAYNINELLKEMDNNQNKNGPLPERILWDASLKSFPEIQFEVDMANKKSMYDLLINFYKYGFIIIKNAPIENKFLLKFVNSIGPVKITNFGEYFDVMSKPNPNDLAYKPIALPPHTDNPYRKPTAPGIQFLHCLQNEVSGGFSTLVDGFAVAEYIKKITPKPLSH